MPAPTDSQPQSVSSPTFERISRNRRPKVLLNLPSAICPESQIASTPSGNFDAVENEEHCATTGEVHLGRVPQAGRASKTVLTLLGNLRRFHFSGVWRQRPWGWC